MNAKETGINIKPHILITGCSTGIGFDAAISLHKLGYQVTASCRQIKDVQRLQQLGITCYQLDLEDSESINKAVASIVSEIEEPIEVLFNNGAFGIPGAVEDLKRDTLRHQFEVNVFGTQELTNLIIPIMRNNGGGKIIYNSSILGFVAMPFRGAYNASKYAIEGLADTLRLELKPDNIQVSLIEPGPIQTNFRKTSYEKFLNYVQSPKDKPSFHEKTYQTMIQRLVKEGPAAPFTLDAEAVTACLIHAIEAKKIKIRYPVTIPTKLFAVLKRILPTRMLDALLNKAGSDKE